MVGEVLDVIKELSKEGMTLIIVTHEMKFAKDVSTRVLFLDKGIILESGTPSEVFEHTKEEKNKRILKKI